MGTFRIDGSNLSVTPSALSMRTGERQQITFTVPNAAPPGGGPAWLSVLPNGEVVHFDPDGQRSSDGVWQGCNGPIMRTCTLVSHLYTLQRVARATRGGVTVGVGVGVGF